MILRTRTRVRRWPPLRARRWIPPAVLTVALLAVALAPSPGSVAGQQIACSGSCHAHGTQVVNWTSPLPGSWSAEDGVAGTVPSSGEAYVAAGGGIVVVGDGVNLYAYEEASGALRWALPLTGFPAGSAIAAVRAWDNVVTAGVLTPTGQRTEVVVETATGLVMREFPAARFGGAVAASRGLTVIVGAAAVTAYDTRSGRVRWRVAIGPHPPAWRATSTMLYIAESAGGYLGQAPITALREIALNSGTTRTVLPPSGSSFPGELSQVGEGVVLFSAAEGVMAYDPQTGAFLWSAPGAVPEGDDPYQHRLYLTAGNTLEGVRPRTGQVLAKIPGSSSGAAAGMYVVRDGTALGLDEGSGGTAWGYSLAQGRVTWSVDGVAYPHFFTDLSGLGGSVAVDSRLVIIAACTREVAGTALPTQPSSQASPSVQASSSPSVSSSPSPGSGSPTPPASPPPSCTRPELVALAM